jgi:hypothetical protein
MLRRKKILRALYARRLELAIQMRRSDPIHPHTHGMYDELNRTIDLIEGRK